jgi:hypothetical protein
VETGIPQINADRLNHRHSFDRIDVMTQDEFDRWFASLPRCLYDVVESSGVHNTAWDSNKLTKEFYSNSRIGMNGLSLNSHSWTDTRDNLCLDSHVWLQRRRLSSILFGHTLSRNWMEGRRRDVPAMVPLVQAKYVVWITLLPTA